MTNNYMITTDNMADLPLDYLTQQNIPYVKLSYIMDGKTYEGRADFDSKHFYQLIREGCMPTTSQVSYLDAKDFFEAYLKQGKDILHISFSSGLSGSYNNCYVAAQELKAEYPDRNIVVIDSLCASLGEGLCVDYAVRLRAAGKSITEAAHMLEEKKLHICHFFTVDDLNHLYRGGRVSRFSAVAGGILSIKPVLHVDNEGHLIPIGKVRGRHASLRALVDHMENNMIPDENTTIFITHGDCLEAAEYVRDLVKEKYHINNFLINTVGPVIGTHSGPGTVALFFFGKER